MHALIYLLVNGFLVVIWAVTSGDFFWPIFPIAGWGIGLAANAWEVYGRRPISEAEIRREMDRLRELRARPWEISHLRPPPPDPCVVLAAYEAAKTTHASAWANSPVGNFFAIVLQSGGEWGTVGPR